MKNLLKDLAIILGVAGMLLLIVSCGPKQKSADGYYFEEESFTRLDTQVKVVLVKSQAEMNRLLAQHGKKIQSGREVAAFSTLSMSESSCTIYMIDPKISYQPEFIGHEFTHCLYGNWHTVQP